MSKRYSQIGIYRIYWDENYYIAYAGGKRDLSEKDKSEWNKTLSLPATSILRYKEQSKLIDKNPNLVPIKGLDLVEIIKDKGLVPFFDSTFNQSHVLNVTDFVVYESIKAKSYEIAMNNLKGI